MLILRGAYGGSDRYDLLFRRRQEYGKYRTGCSDQESGTQMGENMAVTKETLYLKGEQSVEVKKKDVTIGDILSLECANPEIIPKVKALKLMKITRKGGTDTCSLF